MTGWVTARFDELSVQMTGWVTARFDELSVQMTGRVTEHFAELSAYDGACVCALSLSKGTASSRIDELSAQMRRLKRSL
jgi:hypothetical protein